MEEMEVDLELPPPPPAPPAEDNAGEESEEEFPPPPPEAYRFAQVPEGEEEETPELPTPLPTLDNGSMGKPSTLMHLCNIQRFGPKPPSGSAKRTWQRKVRRHKAALRRAKDPHSSQPREEPEVLPPAGDNSSPQPQSLPSWARGRGQGQPSEPLDWSTLLGRPRAGIGRGRGLLRLQLEQGPGVGQSQGPPSPTPPRPLVPAKAIDAYN